MTRDKSDALGITAQCREPEPLACYERQHSYEQSGDGACLCCPVASWIAAMVLSDNESLAVGELPILGQWFNPNSAGESVASITFGLKAA
jgi:hypothetical protein